MTPYAPRPRSSELRAVGVLLRPYGATGWLGVLAAIVGAALRVAIVPLFVAPVLDQVMAQGDLAALPAVLVTTGAAVLGMSAALLLQDAALAAAGARLVADQRERAYRALLARTPGRLPGTSGGLSGRILSDLREVETYHQYGIGTLVTEGAAVVGITLYLAWSEPTATGALVVFVLPIAFLLAWLGRRLRRQADRAQAGTEAVAAHLQEGLRHHAVARAFRAEPFLLARFGLANDATRRAATRRGLLAALQSPASQLAVFAALAGLVALLAGRAAAGTMSVGQVVEFLTLVALLSTPAQLLPRGYALWRQAQAAAMRLATLEATEPDAAHDHAAPAAASTRAAPSASDAPASPAGAEGLTLVDLHVRYPDGALVLAGASARLPRRGLAVLVGDSGAGKSTLFAALLGFLPIERGEVRLHGQPVGPADPRVAWVPQGLDLLRASVRDNVALGRRTSEQAILAALRSVQMLEVVQSLAGGLDHRLSEDGAGLSGGQRQRLLVARAILEQPALLLADEPTAALDPEAEAALIRSLQHEAKERLVWVVAHREALAHAADHVWRLQDGRLVQEGP